MARDQFPYYLLPSDTDTEVLFIRALIDLDKYHLILLSHLSVLQN